MHQLTTIANKYFTDKGTTYTNVTLCKNSNFNDYRMDQLHNYTRYYEIYFEKYKNKHINILEIGTGAGGSTLMLNEYFNCNCDIYTLDCCDLKLTDNIPLNIHLYKNFDQSNETSLKNFCEEMNNNNIRFDIIIDDGSHKVSHQMITYKYFINLIKQDGIYIIEDCHTSLTYQKDDIRYDYKSACNVYDNDDPLNTILSFFILNYPYNKFDKYTNIKLLNNIYCTELLSTHNVINTYDPYMVCNLSYSGQKYIKGMSLIIHPKIFDCKIYVCANKEFNWEELLEANNHEIIYNNECNNKYNNKQNELKELYQLYEIYQNKELSNYIGICDDKKYFDIDWVELYNSKTKIYQNYDIILPQKIKTNSHKENNNIKYIKILFTIIKKYYPEYLQTFCDVFNNDYIYPYNMFIMNKKLFMEYCEFIFDIFDYVIKYCDLNNINVNYNIFTQYLLTIFVYKNQLNTYETNIKIYD